MFYGHIGEEPTRKATGNTKAMWWEQSYVGKRSLPEQRGGQIRGDEVREYRQGDLGKELTNYSLGHV